MTLTDAEIIESSRADATRFGAIFDRHHHAIYRYVANRVGPDAADSIAADVFLVSLQRRSDFQPVRDSALPWLYGIANRLVSQHRRAEERHLRAFARSARREQRDIPDDVTPADARVDAQRLDARMAEAVMALPAEQREALLLLAWADLSYADIAAATGASMGTVGSRLNRARRAVQKSLSTYIEGAHHG